LRDARRLGREALRQRDLDEAGTASVRDADFTCVAAVNAVTGEGGTGQLAPGCRAFLYHK
jgi:hypothetical protein